MEDIVVCRDLKVFNSDEFYKIIEDIIKFKGCLKSARIKRCLKRAVLRRTYIFLTTHSLFFFNITNKSFLFNSSSTNTNNPPPVYIKYSVYNKFVTFLCLSFPLPLISIFYFFFRIVGKYSHNL